MRCGHSSFDSLNRVCKAFKNQDQDQAQVKNYFTMAYFETYYNY